MKKVLFISPTPTHPTNAGNRLHIKSLVSFFKQQNWDTHFLYLAYENYDKEAMFSYFESNVEVVTKDKIFQNKKTPSYIFNRLSSLAMKFLRRVQLSTGVITKEQYLYNHEVDDYFSVFVKKAITQLQKKNSFQVVVCEYAAMSKALTFFDKRVFKILDTHDKFTDRFNTYLENGLKPGWVSLYKGEEQKAMNRADLVLAVQKDDMDFFSARIKKKVILFGYIPELKFPAPSKPSKTLLYIGSNNSINVNTINLFVGQFLPLILAENSEVKLIIGGSICEGLKIKHPNIFLTGTIDCLETFYAMGDLVINPELSGTGYKIKALEALAYGMPLVATLAGAAGAIEPFENHLFIANTPAAFANTVNKLLNDPGLLKETSVKAHHWISNYTNKLNSELLASIPG